MSAAGSGSFLYNLEKLLDDGVHSLIQFLTGHKLTLVWRQTCCVQVIEKILKGSARGFCLETPINLSHNLLIDICTTRNLLIPEFQKKPSEPVTGIRPWAFSDEVLGVRPHRFLDSIFPRVIEKKRAYLRPKLFVVMSYPMGYCLVPVVTYKACWIVEEARNAVSACQPMEAQ